MGLFKTQIELIREENNRFLGLAHISLITNLFIGFKHAFLSDVPLGQVYGCSQGKTKEHMAANVVKTEELDICLFVASESKKTGTFHML